MSTPTTPTRQTVAQIKAADIHGEHPRYTREDWQQEAAAGDTQLGYWEWCEHCEERDEGNTPTTATLHAPSPSAIRAAKRFRAEVIGLSNESTESLARIIDEETNTGELAEALRLALPALDHDEKRACRLALKAAAQSVGTDLQPFRDIIDSARFAYGNARNVLAAYNRT